MDMSMLSGRIVTCEGATYASVDANSCAVPVAL